MRGLTAPSWRNSLSNVTSPNRSWKKTAESPTAATDRAIAAAIAVPRVPHRVDRDASATARIVALLGCSNSRITIGLKLVGDDCAQSIEDTRSPGSQSRSPTKLNPGPL